MGQLVSDVTEILQYKDAKKAAETERQKILEEIAKDEQKKTNLINKTLSTQKAKYGASGMSGRSLTEGAVLKRLKEEAAEPYEEKKKTNLEKLKKTKASKPNLLVSILQRFEDLIG